MATKTLYLKNALAGTSIHMSLQDGGSAPTTATTGTGWIVGKVAPTTYALMDSQTERASSVQLATVQPDATSGPDGVTLGDCWRTENKIAGSFASANWAFHFPVIGVTRSTGTQDGVIRFRMWKSANEDGSSPIEIGTVQDTASGYVDLSNSAAQDCALTTYNPGAFSLADEYLFIQTAVKNTGAGDNNGSDVLHRVGSTAYITTSDFTASINLFIPWIYGGEAG